MKEEFMAEQKNKDGLKHIMINFGVMLVLVGSTAVKADNLAFFFMGLMLHGVNAYRYPGIRFQGSAKCEETRYGRDYDLGCSDNRCRYAAGHVQEFFNTTSFFGGSSPREYSDNRRIISEVRGIGIENHCLIVIPEETV